MKTRRVPWSHIRTSVLPLLLRDSARTWYGTLRLTSGSLKLKRARTPRDANSTLSLANPSALAPPQAIGTNSRRLRGVEGTVTLFQSYVQPRDCCSTLKNDSQSVPDSDVQARPPLRTFELGFGEATGWTATVFDEDEGLVAGPLFDPGEEVVLLDFIGDVETFNDTDFVAEDAMTVECETIGTVGETAFML
jgi:hypothetical protein